MSHEVVAFGRGEELECGGDQRADLIEGSWPRRPEEGLQLRTRQPALKRSREVVLTIAANRLIRVPEVDGAGNRRFGRWAQRRPSP